VAPVARAHYLSARELIEQMITRSSNTATDALLAAVGGPSAVNDWARRAGIQNFNLTRDIATLVRDDGEVNPAVQIDIRDSATPRDMVKLLAGIYQGQWLSASSRQRDHRRDGALPHRHAADPRADAGDVRVAHKTGTLSNTSSDIGIITGPDGRSIAVAIYVTGQGGKANRDAKIATLARVLYDGYGESARQ
jgi:beta-lactamase class A